jgi:hypothetical protein
MLPLCLGGVSERKTSVGKSTSGPDWVDVEMLMRAMSALHSGQVGLTFLPRGIGGTGGMSVGASIMLDVRPGSSIEPSVSVIKNWPCASHAELPAHCFALLHELDFKVGQMYQNEALWQ